MKNNSIKLLATGAIRSIRATGVTCAVALVAAGCSFDSDFDDATLRSNNNQKYSNEPKGTYGIRVGATSYDEPETRAEYDGVTYKWSPRDKVGFFMMLKDSYTPTVSNVALTTANTVADRFAEFNGALTHAQIDAINPDAQYDYYSYYAPSLPGESQVLPDASFPTVPFNIPNEITLTPNVFPAEYGFMYGTKVTTAEGQKPITWLDGANKQQYGEYIGIKYNHAFAFLEVYLEANLMTRPVTKIVVTTPSGSMSGTANINITNGTISGFTGGQPSITVNIAKGVDNKQLDIWKDGNGVAYNRIWIPIDPAQANRNLQFDFYTEGNNKSLLFESQSKGGSLLKGQKHKVGFVLPFHVDFRQDLTGSNKSFSSYGHTITANTNNVEVDGQSLYLEGHASQSSRDAIKLPLLNNVVHPDYNIAELKVTIKIEAYYRTAWFLGQNDYRRLYYAVTTETEYNIPNSSASFALNRDSYTTNESPQVSLGDTSYVTFRVGIPTELSEQYIRQIWVYPQLP
jgi:hypothetical protein